MEKEEAAFRRMLAKTVVSGPEPLTAREIHDVLGINEKMVTAAKKAVKEEEQEEQEARIRGTGTKSRFVTNALTRRRRTNKFAEKRKLIQNFYEDNSTPTSRKRDVVSIKVNE